MKTLLVSLSVAALGLSGCGSSSSEVADPVLPPVEVPVEPVDPPVEEPVVPVVPEPDCDLTGICDVYVEPIDVVISPIEGVCLGIPVVITQEAQFIEVNTISSCGGEDYYHQNTDYDYNIIGFDWKYATSVTANTYGSEIVEDNHVEYFSSIAAEYGDVAQVDNTLNVTKDGVITGYFRSNNNSDTGNISANVSTHTLTISTRHYNCSINIHNSGTCEDNNSSQRHHIPKDALLSMPIVKDTKEDYAFTLWNHFKKSLYL